MTTTIGSSRAPGGSGWTVLGAKLAEPAHQAAPDVLFSTIQHFNDRAKSLEGRPAGYFSLGPVAQTFPASIPPSAPAVTQKQAQTRALTRPGAAISAAAIDRAPIDGVTGMPSFSETKVRTGVMPRITTASDGLQRFAAGGLLQWGFVDPVNAQAVARAQDQNKVGAPQPTTTPGAPVVATTPVHKYALPAMTAAAVLLFAVL